MTPLRLEFARKTAEIIFLVISLRYGTVAIAFSSVLAGVTALVMAFVPNIKILQYSIKEAVNVQSIQIRIGEITIEVPDGADSNHLEMVLKAVRNAR